MAEPTETITAEQNSEPRPRLLVVDDQPLNIQMLYEIFHRDHEVFTAISGRQALEMCRNNPPDLILLDVMMPGMGGLEVCQLLKQESETRDIPIIFVTAMNSSKDENAGFEAGAVDFITKPVNSVKVRARVHTHLTLKLQSDLLRNANEQMSVKNDQLRKTQDILSEKVAELEATLNKVQQLEGIIPICMHCKKIRDDKDYWQQMEQYISEHSKAMFSHSICPDCIKGLYPDLYAKMVQDKRTM